MSNDVWARAAGEVSAVPCPPPTAVRAFVCKVDNSMHEAVREGDFVVKVDGFVHEERWARADRRASVWRTPAER